MGASLSHSGLDVGNVCVSNLTIDFFFYIVYIWEGLEGHILPVISSVSYNVTHPKEGVVGNHQPTQTSVFTDHFAHAGINVNGTKIQEHSQPCVSFRLSSLYTNQSEEKLG